MKLGRTSLTVVTAIAAIACCASVIASSASAATRQEKQAAYLACLENAEISASICCIGSGGEWIKLPYNPPFCAFVDDRLGNPQSPFVGGGTNVDVPVGGSAPTVPLFTRANTSRRIRIAPTP